MAIWLLLLILLLINKISLYKITNNISIPLLNYNSLLLMLNHWTVPITFSFVSIFLLAALFSLFKPFCSSLFQPITEKWAFPFSDLTFLSFLCSSSLSWLLPLFLHLILIDCAYLHLTQTFPFLCLTISVPQQHNIYQECVTYLSLQLGIHGRDVNKKLPWSP